jgi:ketosteroid isomerase-like protein
MNRDEALEYARQWTEAWNRLDVEGVLQHFDDDVVFSSPKALAAVGVPTVRGKGALRDYWMMALQPVKSLRFTVMRVIWDPDASELAIIYDREVNGRDDRASEILQFGPGGRVVRGEVFYGVRESQEHVRQ